MKGVKDVLSSKAASVREFGKSRLLYSTSKHRTGGERGTDLGANGLLSGTAKKVFIGVTTLNNCSIECFTVPRFGSIALRLKLSNKSS